jgi:hypothetical protein
VTSRRSTSRGLPICWVVSMNGRSNSHCPSVKSLVYRCLAVVLVMVRYLLLWCGRLYFPFYHTAPNFSNTLLEGGQTRDEAGVNGLRHAGAEARFQPPQSAA